MPKTRKLRLTWVLLENGKNVQCETVDEHGWSEHRPQPGMHTKTVLIDGKEVLVGCAARRGTYHIIEDKS